MTKLLISTTLFLIIYSLYHYFLNTRLKSNFLNFWGVSTFLIAVSCIYNFFLKVTWNHQFIHLRFVCALLVVISCNRNVEKKPENLVPKEKMIEILADIHRLEGHVNNMNIQNTDTLAFIYLKMEAEVFKKHAIDTASYYKSYKYYLVDPQEFTLLYEEVVAKIKAKNQVDSTLEAKNKKSIADTTKLDKFSIKKDKILRQKNAKFDSIKANFRNKLIK